MIEVLREQIAELCLTERERDAIQRAIDAMQTRAAEMHTRSWHAAVMDEDCDALCGLLDRTK